MLINGDLIRIPQNTILYGNDDDSWKLHVTKKSDYGIVIESNVDKMKIKILYDGDLWMVNGDKIRLVGGNDVHKALQG